MVVAGSESPDHLLMAPHAPRADFSAAHYAASRDRCALSLLRAPLWQSCVENEPRQRWHQSLGCLQVLLGAPLLRVRRGRLRDDRCLAQQPRNCLGWLGTHREPILHPLDVKPHVLIAIFFCTSNPRPKHCWQSIYDLQAYLLIGMTGGDSRWKRHDLVSICISCARQDKQQGRDRDVTHTRNRVIMAKDLDVPPIPWAS